MYNHVNQQIFKCIILSPDNFSSIYYLLHNIILEITYPDTSKPCIYSALNILNNDCWWTLSENDLLRLFRTDEKPKPCISDKNIEYYPSEICQRYFPLSCALNPFGYSWSSLFIFRFGFILSFIWDWQRAQIWLLSLQSAKYPQVSPQFAKAHTLLYIIILYFI